MAEFLFKYHDSKVFYNGGAQSFESFIAQNINFPLVKNEYFEYGINTYGRDRLDLINSEGHHLPFNLDKEPLKYKKLLTAIKTFL